PELDRGGGVVTSVRRCEAAPADKRTPGPPGREANPGFYAESGDRHSVREPTPMVNPRDPARCRFRGPLRRPRGSPRTPPPPHAHKARGASDMSPVGRPGKPAWGAPPPPRRTVIREGASPPVGLVHGLTCSAFRPLGSGPSAGDSADKPSIVDQLRQKRATIIFFHAVSL